MTTPFGRWLQEVADAVTEDELMDDDIVAAVYSACAVASVDPYAAASIDHAEIEGRDTSEIHDGQLTVAQTIAVAAGYYGLLDRLPPYVTPDEEDYR